MKAAEDKGFKLHRRVQGWALLEFISMPKFFELIKIVDGVLEERAKAKAAERASRPKKASTRKPRTQAEVVSNRRSPQRKKKSQTAKAA